MRAVQFTTNLGATNWLTLTSPLVLSNGLLRLEHEPPGDSPRGFYRVIRP